MYPMSTRGSARTICLWVSISRMSRRLITIWLQFFLNVAVRGDIFSQGFLAVHIIFSLPDAFHRLTCSWTAATRFSCSLLLAMKFLYIQFLKVKYLSKRKLKGRAVNRTTHPRCSVRKFCMEFLKEAKDSSVLSYESG